MVLPDKGTFRSAAHVVVGDAIEWADLAERGDEDREAVRTLTDRSGRFRIPHLEPGDYSVNVCAVDFAGSTNILAKDVVNGLEAGDRVSIELRTEK